MTQLQDILDKARESVSVREVFGEAIQNNGVTIIPVARVKGAGGGGTGTGTEGEGTGQGYALQSEPVGVYVIRGDNVVWQPAVNVNKIVAGGQLIAILGILTAPRILKQFRKLRKVH